MSILIDTDAKIIGESAYGFGQNRIIQLNNGHLYTCFINDSNDIEIYKNEGNGWQLDYTIQSLNSPAYVSLSRSPDNDIFLGFNVYVSGNNYNAKVYRKLNGGSWEFILEHDISYSRNRGQSIVLSNRSSSNTLYNIYFSFDSRYIPNQGTYNGVWVNIKYSSDKGNNFDTTYHHLIHSLSFTPYAYLLGADIDASGYIYIGLIYYYSTFFNECRVKIIKCPIDASSKTVIVDMLLSSDINDQWLSKSLVVDSNGNVYWSVYFYDYSDSTYYFKVFKNSTEILSISSSSDFLMHGMLSLGCDAYDNIIVIYTKRDDYKVYSRRYKKDISTWESEIILTPNTYGYRPSLQMHPRINYNVLNFIHFGA